MLHMKGGRVTVLEMAIGRRGVGEESTSQRGKQDGEASAPEVEYCNSSTSRSESNRNPGKKHYSGSDRIKKRHPIRFPSERMRFK